MLLALSVDVLKAFAFGNASFFASLSVFTTESTDLLFGRGPALEILFCSCSKGIQWTRWKMSFHLFFFMAAVNKCISPAVY